MTRRDRAAVVCEYIAACERARRVAVKRIAEPAEPGEEWRAIDGFGGRYEVSSFGRVRSAGGTHHTPRILAQSPVSARKRASVGLWEAGRQERRNVHRMVCAAFNGPPPTDRHYACHNDGNPANNRADNLRWGTASENQADRVTHGTLSFKMPEHAIRRGTAHHSAKLSPETVASLRADRAAGMKYKALQARYGISSGTLSDILAGRTWKVAS